MITEAEVALSINPLELGQIFSQSYLVSRINSTKVYLFVTEREIRVVNKANMRHFTTAAALKPPPAANPPVPLLLP